MNPSGTPTWLRRTIVAALLGGLLIVGFVILRPFLTAVAWAAILVYVSWPLHLRLLASLGGRRFWSALAMTLLFALVFGATLLWLTLLLQREGLVAVREIAALLRNGVELPEALVGIPWLGPWLQERLVELGGDPAAWGRQLAEWGEQWGERIGAQVMGLLGDLGLNALRFTVALLTAFFLFRDGERLLAETRQVLLDLLGTRVDGYLDAIGDTTRAVVYGLLLAAVAQGVMAGLGYWVAGVTAPVFWGATTALVALIPFGAPLIWGSLGVWLLARGDTAAGVGLLLWGALAVSWIDNLVRPWVISGVSNIPFLLVLFGVLGGLAAFGLIGLFVGPVILAILLALWREWATDTGHHPPRPGA
ncbi:MAG: AI-2E family transporter [Hydrogenophaga sp.]|uniref:AI-2E family transporter n=1 Tax=Hydrogenophaga sp. TaxID=1904254 RepID=UPI00272FB774|nr:AI-2E family transporter [Hydrogenophaga sp.]MDP2164263.1 AI-2E family transporter [Hydrogenophaga sp.]MDP3477485.1 AI-2E family transporter [Hydrogenophaga sp.]